MGNGSADAGSRTHQPRGFTEIARLRRNIEIRKIPSNIPTLDNFFSLGPTKEEDENLTSVRLCLYTLVEQTGTGTGTATVVAHASTNLHFLHPQSDKRTQGGMLVSSRAGSEGHEKCQSDVQCNARCTMHDAD